MKTLNDMRIELEKLKLQKIEIKQLIADKKKELDQTSTIIARLKPKITKRQRYLQKLGEGLIRKSTISLLEVYNNVDFNAAVANAKENATVTEIEAIGLCVERRTQRQENVHSSQELIRSNNVDEGSRTLVSTTQPRPRGLAGVSRSPVTTP
jgi:hypothetical protein